MIFFLIAKTILFWGVFFWVPKVCNYYGTKYFHWSAPKKFSRILRLFIFIILNVLNKIIFSAYGAEFLILGALILVSLWGTVFVDAHLNIIPDRFQWLGGLSTIGFIIAHYQFHLIAITPAFISSLVQGLSLSIIIFLAAVVYKKLRKTEEAGLGFGDIKLLFWQGLFLGQYNWAAFFVAVGLAGILTLPRVFIKRTGWTATFAFAPYIVFGFVFQAVLGRHLFTA